MQQEPGVRGAGRGQGWEGGGGPVSGKSGVLVVLPVFFADKGFPGQVECERTATSLQDGLYGILGEFVGPLLEGAEGVTEVIIEGRGFEVFDEEEVDGGLFEDGEGFELAVEVLVAGAGVVVEVDDPGVVNHGSRSVANTKWDKYTLGARFIRKLRQEAGLTQKELAEKMGIVKSSISRYEQGRDKPRPAVMKAMMEMLSSDPGNRLRQLLYLYTRGALEEKPDVEEEESPEVQTLHVGENAGNSDRQPTASTDGPGLASHTGGVPGTFGLLSCL